MVYYNAYIQLTSKEILIIVANEKNKNQTVIVDSFQMEIKDYTNDNGLIQYPLILAEDIANKINNEKYSVKDIVLVLSPKGSIVTTIQENVTLSPKELAEFAKTKTENAFKKHPEAYEVAWMHTGNIFDGGTPYTVFLQYCYPLREINKLKKAFAKNKIHISDVILPEVATAALFAQYYDDFNDPTTLIVESGFISTPNTATVTCWYRRNVLDNIGGYKAGFSTIVKEIGNAYTQLRLDDIESLVMSCGLFKEYPTDDADEILSLNGINKEDWFAVATRAFHSFATTFKSDIQRRSEKPDTIVLTGPLACINGVKEYLYFNYSLVVEIWENKFDLKIGQNVILYSNSIIQSPLFSTVMGAVYHQHWTKGMKKGTLSKPIVEININNYKRQIIFAFIVSILYAGYLYLPGFIELKLLQSEQKKINAEAQTAQIIQANIDKYEQNIFTQKQFLERAQKNSFNMKEFMFSAALLKPSDVTIISIDTPNYLEKIADTQPFYYIRKAVENKLKVKSGEIAQNEAGQHELIDISGKDWTFGLDWQGIPLTTEGITAYLAENNQLNVSAYLITKVVIRGYGPQDKVAIFTKDLGEIKGVQRADIVSSEEKSVPDGGGSIITSNVFEINVWFGRGINNATNSEDSN